MHRFGKRDILYPITNPAEIADKNSPAHPLLEFCHFLTIKQKKILTQSLESLLVNIKNNQKDGKKVVYLPAQPLEMVNPLHHIIFLNI